MVRVKFKVVWLLVGLSVALAIYRLSRGSHSLGERTVYTIGESFGYAVAPWVIGGIVALTRAAYARVRGKPTDIARSLAWATGIFLALMTGATFAGGDQGIDRQKVRDSALRVMGASVAPAGLAAYCDKYVARNPEILDAVEQWNKRNRAYMETTVKVMRWAGDLTSDERAQLDRAAMQTVKKMVESEEDRVSYCRALATALPTGAWDLDKIEGIASDLKTILSIKVAD